MTTPITGPHLSNIDTPTLLESKRWFRQRRPYNLPLSFAADRSVGQLDAYGGSTAGSGRLFTQQWGSSERAYAQAYARLVGQLGDNASLGISLVQWRQSADMIVNRSKQLGAFTTALYRRSPLGIASSLGISVRKVQKILGTRHGVSRSPANLWLEFWFGWKPMVSDIYAASEVFDQELPLVPIKGRGVELRTWETMPEPFSKGQLYSGTTRCLIGCNVRVANPNLRLMQQFGILNPASVAFDGIPWSFVLGWFSNVNSWLGSFTDFAGLDISNGYVTDSVKVKGLDWWPDFPGRGGYVNATRLNRRLIDTIPRPSFLFKQLKFEPTRAATAISLLIQKLPR